MLLDPADVIAGAAATRSVVVPADLLALWPSADGSGAAPSGGVDARPRTVTMRSLTIGDVGLITRAARDDPGMTPVLMVVRAVVEPALTLETVQRLPAGLAAWLLEEVSQLSGLAPGTAGEVRKVAGDGVLSAYTRLARRYGWTPDQVDRLTPTQLALFLTDADEPAGEGS